MNNPYSKCATYQFWRRGCSRVNAHDINPATKPRFKIHSSDKVATAGSCFAQHISTRIRKIGFNFFCPERDSRLREENLDGKNLDIFSARYGNIYTVQQLYQLFMEAVSGQQKHERFWVKDGLYFDPYRPTVYSSGFHSEKELITERKKHLSCVKMVFEKCDIFVFTLGLTEAWRSKFDGAVFQLAPGVVAGNFDSLKHEFHNFSIDETRSALFQFLEALKILNPSVKVLLTVSPVPLIATYEDRHVLSSTIYSKSVLRIAAQEAYDKFPFVDYFPSFEIITGSPTGGLYFEDDMREVNSLGVSHAMRIFLETYAPEARFSRPMETKEINAIADSEKEMAELICDEKEIELSVDIN